MSVLLIDDLTVKCKLMEVKLKKVHEEAALEADRQISAIQIK